MSHQPELYKKFEAHFRLHYQSLAEYAFSIVKNREDAEDAVQDVFIKIWQNKPAVIDKEGFKFYLFTATKNTCISILRKQAAMVPYMGQEKDGEETLTADDTAHSNVNYSDLIEEAFALLPPQCRVIFKLSRLANLTYVQIATELGLSVKTIENQMGKAIRIMREFARNKNIPLPLLCLFLLQYLKISAGAA